MHRQVEQQQHVRGEPRDEKQQAATAPRGAVVLPVRHLDDRMDAALDQEAQPDRREGQVAPPRSPPRSAPSPQRRRPARAADEVEAVDDQAEAQRRQEGYGRRRREVQAQDRGCQQE